VSIDPEALAASLRRLADRGDDGTVLSALNQVAQACVELFSVTGSGIMLADEQNAQRYVASTDGPGRVLEHLEAELGEGPCTDAFVYGGLMVTSDLTADGRWPTLAKSVAPLAIHAVLGVPVRLGAITVGTLDIYRDHAHHWTEAEETALLRYSELVSSTLMAALAAHEAGELVAQLQYALDYRVVIERGVGYVMARDGVDAVTAFNRLRRAARSSQRKIGDVAEVLLATGRLPGARG
jgi:GAF domain-containing protein